MKNVLLNLSEDGRVLSASFCRNDTQGASIIPRESLPDGDVTQYRYVDGAFVHDPLPEPEPETPTPTPEERIAALEEQNAMLTECLLEMSEIVYG